MIRTMSVVVALLAAVGCSRSASEPASEGLPPATVKAPPAETFAGTWRSVTPSLEFIRLTVVSKSSEQGALAARLTLSGLAWEGSGRIQGDSLALDMAVVGAGAPSGVVVARARDARTLQVQMRSGPAGPVTDLTFVREN